METSLMSESVVDAVDVEETVTQVLTHFVQGGGEQAVMSVQLLQEQVDIQLGYDQGSLSKWHNFVAHCVIFVAHFVIFSAPQARFFDFFDFFGAAGPIFCFFPTSLDFLVSRTTNAESVAGPKSSELLTYLLVGHVQNLYCFTHWSMRLIL
jgi:hypothetical protein